MAVQLITSRWFQLADLILVSLGGAILYVYPQAGWWPLLFCLLPWMLRLAVGYFPFRQTVFDPAILVFAMTAAGGVWATYNREAGWAKFWLILASIFLYYALARQPRENLWLVTSLLSLLVGYLALNFLLSPDLPGQSADFEIITKIKRGWLDLRPALTIHAPLPNITAGILAMLIPFPLALGVRAWRERNTSITLLTIVVGGLALFSLLLSSSRGAWLALAVTGGIGLLWRLSQFAAKRVGKSPYLILGLCLFVVAGQLFWLSLTYPGGPIELANRLRGVPSGGSRLELVHGALNLIMDFPFTGGGLGAFGGLYSQYIMVIPHFLFSYSHNFYLDVALEQGLLGLLAIAVVILGSAWRLVKSSYLSPGTNNSHSIGTVVLASLLVVILHGLVDDALYGNQATPQLFLLPGMAIAATRPDGGLNRVHVPRLDLSKVLTPGLENRPRWIGAAFVFVTALIAPLIIFREPITAAWLANLGAVEMARIELADFPSGRWDDGHNVNALAPTATVLKRALQLNPQNRTANHRLGMIAMVQRDFTTATFHLQQAYIADPDHRGVTKALGYCYTWAGKLNEAVRLLANIPEAEHEMEVYVWWWRTQQRGDLADQAAQMAALLKLTHARPIWGPGLIHRRLWRPEVYGIPAERLGGLRATRVGAGTSAASERESVALLHWNDVPGDEQPGRAATRYQRPADSAARIEGHDL